MRKVLLLLLLVPYLGKAQNNGPSIKDKPLTAIDSLSIFELIDSLMTMDEIPTTSQLAVRVGYNSNINATGRSFAFNEYGLSSKVAYYHSSGLFIDVTGYFSNQFQPGYYLTVPAIGYMLSGKKKWSFILEYDRYIYNIKQVPLTESPLYTYNNNYSSTTYKNIFTGSAFYKLDNFNFKFDLSVLTGDRTGYRFGPTLFYSFEKRNWKGIKKISFYPTINALWGIEQIEEYIPLYSTKLEARIRIRRGLPLFRKELKTEFGVMNYAIRFPLSITLKNYFFNMSYNYNFPQRLPGEKALIANGGNFTVAITRYFNIRGK